MDFKKEMPGFTRQDNNPCWVPEEPAEVMGAVVKVEEGMYGNQYTILTKENEEIKTPSHKVLQNRMSKVKTGDVVIIQYTGTEPPSVKGNNPTRMYEVYLKD